MDFRKILSPYGVGFSRVREDVSLFGSPDRTESRAAIVDGEGRTFVLEEVSRADVERKEGIARTLSALSSVDPSLRIVPYVESRNGGFVTASSGRYFQLSPYVSGVPFDRSRYLSDGWRGVAAAGFLIALRSASVRLGTDAGGGMPERFSLSSYTEEMISTVRKHDPHVLFGLDAVTNRLRKEFFPRENESKAAFCHGDYHPMNVIWSESGIAGVIDWEFSGPKTGLYDVANMVGCLGMDDPDALKDAFVREFLSTIFDSDAFADDDREGFADLLLATRFAWLSEWLRFGESELAALEVEYMNLLLEHREFLGRLWGLR